VRVRISWGCISHSILKPCVGVEETTEIIMREKEERRELIIEEESVTSVMGRADLRGLA